MLYATRLSGDAAMVKGLEAHSLDVLRAALAMFVDRGDPPSRVGIAWMRFFRIAPERWPVFRLNLIACALLHDIGKATEGHQEAMNRGRSGQLLRHEQVSALILALPAFRAWLAVNPDLMPEGIIGAVAGHHPKALRRLGNAACPVVCADPVVQDQERLVVREPETLRTFLAYVSNYLDLPKAPPVPTLWTLDGSRGKDLKQAQRALDQVLVAVRGLEHDPMLPALKAALIAADATGSCLPRGDQEIESWLADRFHLAPLSPADIQEQVLARRIALIERRARTRTPDTVFRYRPFQEEAARLPARALLIAPGGTGKILAAWRWIGARLGSHPASRILFLYPAQSPDIDGLKDLILPAPETDASLLSGAAADDLRGIFCNPADTPEDRGEETTARLFAVRLWRRRLLGASLDQFLGFMQQHYRSICLLPLLAESIIVIDEVNSLDAAQLDALTQFLDAFDIPLLCLAASLPANRRAILASHGLTVCPGDPAELDAMDSQARAPRYRMQRLPDEGAAQAIAEDVLDRNQRVLWVVNSVDRCQALAERLRQRDPLCYHTRFKLADRNRRQHEIADRFADAGGPLLLISSPVCEMGLDLDADVLISEDASLPALIRRMERCRRQALPGRPLGEVYLYPTPSHPDSGDAQSATDALVADLLAAGTMSQHDLEARLDTCPARESTLRDGYPDEGPCTPIGAGEPLNDEIVQAVLDSDLPHWNPGREDLIVPIPRGLASYHPRLPGHLYTASARYYSNWLGFRRQPLDRTRDVEG